MILKVQVYVKARMIFTSPQLNWFTIYLYWPSTIQCELVIA